MGILFLMQEQALMRRELGDFGGTFQYPLGPDANQQPAVVVGQTNAYPCSLGADNEGQEFANSGFSPAGQTIIVVRKSVLPAGLVFNAPVNGAGMWLLLTDSLGTVTTQQIAPKGVKDARNCWILTLQNPATGA